MLGGMLKPEIFNRGKKALEEHYIRAGDKIQYIKDHIENIRGFYRTRFAMPEKINILVVQIGKRNFYFDPYDVSNSIHLECLVWDPSNIFPMEIANTNADIVIFIDSTLIPNSWQEFVNEIVPVALRSNIGAVGALVYSGDDKIIAAGRSLMPWGDMRNDFWEYDSGDKHSPAKRTRDVVAVSGAAMAISSTVLKEVLKEGIPDQTMWDVEICFRLNRAGYRSVFTPHAFLLYKGNIEQYHGAAMFDVRDLAEKYNIVKDPYLNTNLIDIDNRTSTDKKIAIPSQFKKKEDKIYNLTEEEKKKIEEQEKKRTDFYHKWLAFHSPDLKKSSERIAKLKYKPFFSIILPTYNSELIFFRELLDSLKSQTYSNFEICISDDASTDLMFIEFLNRVESESDNIRVIYSDKNNGIAGNTNRSISIAKGDWFVLCDHDDLMEPFALEMIAQYINDNPEVDVLYSDEDMVDQKGWRHSPRLQPDWNPDMLLSHMYCPHLVSFKREALDRVCISNVDRQSGESTPFNPQMDGAQDYDFFLRITEKANKIGHIPMILYSWRSVKGSVALDACAKIYAYDAGKRALEAAMRRRGEDAVVLKSSGTKLGVYRIKRSVTLQCSSTHVIEAGSEFLLSMVNNIRNLSPVPVDIVLVCRDSDESCLDSVSHLPNIDVVMVKDSAGRSEIYNAGADSAKGDHLIFSSRFIDLLDSDYPFGLLEHTQRDEIGAVGVKIIYPNGFFYHTGMLLGVNGVAGYAYRNVEQCPGYWHFASCIRNYSAVSWDLIGVSKRKFYEVQGFDLKLSQLGDVDFCLKLIDKGYKNLYTPYVCAVLNRPVHFLEELRNVEEEKMMLERYSSIINNDPMHHPLMSKTLEDFSIGL
ncbi:MAG: glycosyltransferase [Desulfamplus sp.]|nr:glycosyltransferase [Desulfamplus sp.]